MLTRPNISEKLFEVGQPVVQGGQTVVQGGHTVVQGGQPFVHSRVSSTVDGAVQSACTHFLTPRPENRRKFFWDPIWVPDNQKYH